MSGKCHHKDDVIVLCHGQEDLDDFSRGQYLVVSEKIGQDTSKLIMGFHFVHVVEG